MIHKTITLAFSFLLIFAINNLKSQTVECDDCAFLSSPEDIRIYFSSREFTPLSGTITTSNLVGRGARPISQSDIICDQITKIAYTTKNFIPSNSSIFNGNYSLINPSEFPSQSCLQFASTTIIFTDNFTFDNQATINDIENSTQSNCSTLWIHLNNASCSGNEKDELYYKMFSDFDIDECSSSGLDLSPLPQLNNDLPNIDADYRIGVESFAPWVDFGALPVLKLDPGGNPIFDLWTNAYAGDSRFYESNVDPFGTSVRLGQSSLFNLTANSMTGPQTTIINNEAYGDDTQGSNWAFGSVTDLNECDWDCFNPSGSRNSVVSAIDNSIFMLSHTRNQCALPSSDIDNRVKLPFGTIERGSRYYLQIFGVWLHKSYPSAQLSITDSEGKTVLLALAKASDDRGAFAGLVVPIYDGLSIIETRIEIDPSNGAFKRLVRKRDYDEPDALFYSQFIGPLVACDNCTLNISNLDAVEKSGENLWSISNWNNILSNQNPANDCRYANFDLPCEGTSGLCTQ